MQITTTVEITPRRIADLMVSAIEGGSNYWCQHVFLNSDAPKGYDGPWYDNPAVYDDPNFGIEVMDGETGERHQLRLHNIERAFMLMQAFGADNYKGRHWYDFLSENDDATTADVFLQLATFGEVVYG
jgi:hypothetical protein